MVAILWSSQEHGGELLRPQTPHRLPAGPGLEVDPRAQRLRRQLLLGAVSLPEELGHHAQLGEACRTHRDTRVTLVLAWKGIFNNKTKNKAHPTRFARFIEFNCGTFSMSASRFVQRAKRLLSHHKFFQEGSFQEIPLHCLRQGFAPLSPIENFSCVLLPSHRTLIKTDTH